MIQTGLTAPATDTYVISLVDSGGYIEVEIDSGDEIVFTNPFNEDAVAIFQILRDGVALTLDGNDCFQVKVNSGISL